MLLWFIIRSTYLVFDIVSGTELLNHLEFLKRWEHQCVFCYISEVTLESVSGWVQATRRTNLVIGGLELSAPPSDLWGGERAWRLNQSPSGQWFNHPCLGNEAFIKTQEERVWERLGWWTQVHGGEQSVQRPWKLQALSPYLSRASLPSRCSWVTSCNNKPVI